MPNNLPDRIPPVIVPPPAAGAGFQMRGYAITVPPPKPAHEQLAQLAASHNADARVVTRKSFRLADLEEALAGAWYMVNHTGLGNDQAKTVFAAVPQARLEAVVAALRPPRRWRWGR